MKPNMAYSAVDPNIETMNPADRNTAAVRAGYTGYEDYLNNKSSTQSSTGSYGGSTGSTNFEDIVKRSLALQQEANKPAIESQQAAIPEIQKSYAQTRTQLQAEVDPLKQRYQNLIDQITQSGKVQEQRQSVATSGELAKRGILSSSTLAQQELANALNPITSATTLQAKETGLQGEAAQRDLANQIANLTTGETEAIRNVRNAISTLQSGASSSAITNALSILQTNIAQANADALAKERERTYQTITLPTTKYELAKPYYSPSASNTGIDPTVLAALLGGGTGTKKAGWVDSKGNTWTDTSKTPIGTFTGKDGKTYTRYSDGSSGATQWTYQS